MQRGRKKLPDGMKAVTTSIRLRPDRLKMYHRLGGVKWLSEMIDRIIEDINKQHDYMEMQE